MILAALAVAVPACVATAADLSPPADWRVGLHLGSKHFQKDGLKFNNINPGVYVYYQGWTAGTYYNSEKAPSFYVGHTFEYDRWPMVKPGVTLGAITGYRRATVGPMVVPSVLFADTFRLAFVPKIEKGGASVLHLSIERKF